MASARRSQCRVSADGDGEDEGEGDGDGDAGGGAPRGVVALVVSSARSAEGLMLRVSSAHLEASMPGVETMPRIAW